MIQRKINSKNAVLWIIDQLGKCCAKDHRFFPPPGGRPPIFSIFLSESSGTPSRGHPSAPQNEPPGGMQTSPSTNSSGREVPEGAGNETFVGGRARQVLGGASQGRDVRPIAVITTIALALSLYLFHALTSAHTSDNDKGWLSNLQVLKV